MTIGKPIAGEERRARTLKHLIHYGLKMMVRSDLGGKEIKTQMPQHLAELFVGKTAAEAGVIATEFVNSTVAGIQARQSHTVVEIERRAEDLRSSLIKAFEHYKEGRYQEAAGIMAHGIARTLNGEKENDPFPSIDMLVRPKVSPVDHVLN